MIYEIRRNPRMLTLFTSVLLIKGVFSLIVFIPPEINVTLQSDSSIVLNCTYTYTLGVNESINVLIIKKKTSSGRYIDLAKFNDRYTVYVHDGEYLKNRSKLYGFNTGSSSAVLAINKVRCEDDGQYQCYVDYISKDTGLKSIQNTTVYINAFAEKPIFSFSSNNITVEHDVVNLTCSANVGNPQGLLEIWRQNKSSEIYELLGNTSVVYRDIENCTSIAILTVTYNLTRQDNGAMFRCSSRNKYTNNQIPAVHIGPVNVLYSSSNTTIKASFSNSHIFIGDHVEMKCTADGNPNPNYTWKFNLTDIMSSVKYTLSVNNSTLSFTVTDITDSGYYQCVASNYFKGTLFNSSSIVSLTAQEINEEKYSDELGKTCNPCSSTESCVIENGRAICSLNIWIVIAIVFIIITFLLGMTTLRFIWLRRTQRLKIVNNTDTVDMGGYLSPVGEANGTNYEALGQQGSVHVYSTMQNRDLVGHGSNYEALGQETVHEYSTMDTSDLN